MAQAQREMLQQHLQGENFFQTMYASFAQPFFFEPVKYNGQEYFSGDVVWDLDIFSVVNECKK